MGDENRVVTEFITTSDPKGAKEMAAGIQQVKDAAAGATPAQENLNKKTDEGSKAVEGITAKKKEWLAQLKALRHEVPLFGQAIEFIRHPITLGAIAISVIIEKLREFYKQVDEAAAHIQEFENVAGAFARFQVRAVEARERVKQFAEAFNDVLTNGKAVEALLQRITEQLKEQQRIQNESEDLDKAEMIQAVENDPNLSPEQKTAKKLAIERQAREAKKIRDRAAQMNEAKLYDEAATAEAKRVNAANLALPGAREETIKAFKESDRAELTASIAEAQFKAKGPGMLDKERDLRAQAQKAPERGMTIGPSAEHPFGMTVLGRAELEQKADEVHKDYDTALNSVENAKALARAKTFEAQHALGHEQKLQDTLLEGREKGTEYLRRAHDLGVGVLHDAVGDRDAERSRPPVRARAGAAGVDHLAMSGGSLDHAGQQLEGSAGQISRFTSGLNRALENLTQALNQLNGNSGINQKLNKLATDVDELKNQARNGRL